MQTVSLGGMQHRALPLAPSCGVPILDAHPARGGAGG
jgi:hypothetical protein